MLALTVSVQSHTRDAYRLPNLCQAPCPALEEPKGPDKILTLKGSLTTGGGVGGGQLSLLIMSVLHPSNIY